MADDTCVRDEGATWREYPYVQAPGDSDGTLVLSDNRLTFASTGAGVMLDVDLDGFDTAQVAGERGVRSVSLCSTSTAPMPAS